LAKRVKKLGIGHTLTSYPQPHNGFSTELRDFPKAVYSTKSYDSLTSSCLRGLANCTTLRSCTWTRDKTLSTEILEVISSTCFSLKELEINGHATGTYNPEVLLRFTSLNKISLIMPSLSVIEILPNWLQKTGETLTAFHILCKVCKVPQPFLVSTYFSGHPLYN